MCVGAAFMILGFVMLIFYAGACGTYPRPPREQLPPDVGELVDIKEQERRAVRIVARCPWSDEMIKTYPEQFDNNPEYMEWYGSGVIINSTNVLTANHLLCEGAGYKVILADTREYIAEHFYSWADMDIALLVMPDMVDFAETVQIAPPPNSGDMMCIVTGSPKRERKCGKVFVTFTKPGAGDIAHGALTEKGNSGSGTYDMQGRLIGIAVQLQWCGEDLKKPEDERRVCGGASSSLRGVMKFPPKEE
jgi:S1-C subfamily serine protease